MQLRFDLAAAPLDADWKERVRALAGRKLGADGVLRIEARRFRTQEKNRRDARERLADLLESARTPPRPRRPTKASKRRRSAGAKTSCVRARSRRCGARSRVTTTIDERAEAIEDRKKLSTATSPRTIALLASVPVGAAPRSKAAGGPIAEAMKAAIARGPGLRSRHLERPAGGRSRRPGFVDYPYFQERRDNLDRYLKALAAVDLSKLRAAELEALLINAYNAITVASILDHPA